MTATSLVCATVATLAQAVTPMDAPLPDDQITMIECECLDLNEKAGPVGGRTEACSQDYTTKIFHYRLYLPRGYSGDNERRYPCMFVASPGGNANMNPLKDRYRRDRWVVAMLVESRNGKPQWFHNFTAAYDDVVKRVRLLKGYKFCTGVSGGARVASVYPGHRRGFAGVFFQAAGISAGDTPVIEGLRGVPFFASFGDKDYNLYETDEFYRCIAPSEAYEVEVFQGGHGGAPRPTAERALDWLERQVFVEPTATREDQAEAARWYCENQLSRLEGATDAVSRYEIMDRFCRAATGAGDAGVAAAAARFRAEMIEVARDAAVKKEIAAGHALAAAARATAGFHKLMAQKRPRWKDRQMDDAEYRALAEIASVYRGVAERWPDTRAGRLSAVRAKSLGLEFKEAPVGSVFKYFEEAARSGALSVAARRALAVKVWAGPGSPQANAVEDVLRKAGASGEKALEGLLRGKNTKRLREFAEEWSFFPCAEGARARAGELGEEELAGILAKSGFSRANALKKILEVWEAYPSIYARALEAYDVDAKKALEKAVAVRSSSGKERALKGVVSKWKPAPSATQATALLNDIAIEKLKDIRKIERTTTRRSKLKSFIRAYKGTAAAAEAELALKEMVEEQAQALLEKIKKSLRGSALKRQLQSLVRVYEGTRAASEAAEMLKR